MSEPGESARVDGPASRQRSVSIKDVAYRAGVSIATVSRVLNTPSMVSPSTAAKVQDAVRALGYRPNLFAQGLMTKRSRVIAVSLPEWQGDSFSDLLRGADQTARSLGHHLLVTANPHRRGVGAPPSFALDLVDGLIAMVTRTDERDLEALSELEVPVVLLTTSPEPAPTFDAIHLDNGAGAAEAVRHLLEGTPAERCYFVGGPEGNIDSDRRRNAFVETLAAAGHAATAEQINRGRFSFRWGWAWAGRMHERGALRGAAVFAGNDEIALGIGHFARGVGLRAPDDLRLVGFDNSRWCAYLLPPLSSVEVPTRQLGAEAVQTLVRRLREPGAERRSVRLATSLVVRESSRVL